jgi:hypothetical protein
VKEFVCVKCMDREKGCTMIAQNGDRLPLICVDENTRKAITCHWMEIPARMVSLESIFPFE